MSGKFAANRKYVRAEDQLKELDRLMAEGKEDTPEADDLREELEWAERELTREESERLRGLSADLYMLHNEEIYEPRSPAEAPSSRADEVLRARLQESSEQEDFPRMLVLLRQGTAGFPVDQRAYLRSRAYAGLGHLDTALRFMEYAAVKNPADPNYRFNILGWLGELGRLDEQYEQATAYIAEEGASPELLLQCANVLFLYTHGMTREQTIPILETAADASRSALAQLERAVQPVATEARAHARLILGLCYKRLGRHADALGVLNEVLAANKAWDAALVARGLLLVESDPKEALADFRRAAADGTSFFAPYFYLAHHALTHGQYEFCLEMCAKALDRTRENRRRAVVLQWAAIALYHTEGRTPAVQQAFQAALRLDPLNAQLQHNSDLIQAHPTQPTGKWQLPYPTSLTEDEDLLTDLRRAA